MAAVRQLDKQDMLFVAGETDVVYQHTAGLVILDTSACKGFNFEHLKEKVIERIREVPHFRWKLHQVPLDLDLPYWVEDENFRYENHFKRIGVPSPGDREALAEVVAHLYSKHLDRNKPLWEFWFIEGLAGGKCAVLQKLHHCMMDGQGASKLGELLCDFEPDAAPRAVDISITGARAGAVPTWLHQSTTAALHLAQFPGGFYRGMFNMVTPKIQQMLGMKKRNGRSKPKTPVSCFNGDIGSDRGFVFGSLSLAEIKSVRKAFDASVNDVLLALVSTALRNYMLARDELPDLSLRTGIPISVRSEDDDEISNRVTQASVTLATNVADPVARLRAISEECEEMKQMVRGGGKGFIEMIQIMPPIMVWAMMTSTSPEQTSQMLGSNLIVSNVRGSDKPMYIAGARLETMYPMSIITPGMGINFTCVSYVDQVDIGIAIDPQLVPNSWELIEGLHKALAEYTALVKKAAHRPKSVKKNAGKSTTGKRVSSKVKSTSAKKSVAKRKLTASKTGGRSKSD